MRTSTRRGNAVGPLGFRELVYPRRRPVSVSNACEESCVPRPGTRTADGRRAVAPRPLLPRLWRRPRRHRPLTHGATCLRLRPRRLLVLPTSCGGARGGGSGSRTEQLVPVTGHPSGTHSPCLWSMCTRRALRVAKCPSALRAEDLLALGLAGCNRERHGLARDLPLLERLPRECHEALDKLPPHNKTETPKRFPFLRGLVWHRTELRLIHAPHDD